MDHGINPPRRPRGPGPASSVTAPTRTGTAFACNDKLDRGVRLPRHLRPSRRGPDGEYCDEARKRRLRPRLRGPRHAHATTAAGSPVAHAPIFGVDRGPISGVAPGASVIAYRVCGRSGCYASDSVAAVEQAILDGVDVINFSIGGGANPLHRSRRAGLPRRLQRRHHRLRVGRQQRPGRSTAEHPGRGTPRWRPPPRTVRSVDAEADGRRRDATALGSTVTAGRHRTPVVLAAGRARLHRHQDCPHSRPAGSVTGMIVVCARGVNGRASRRASTSARAARPA